MHVYYLERKRGPQWINLEMGPDDPIHSHLIHYMHGFQDAIQMEHPTWTTRIVWLKGDGPQTVRMCGNWKPGGSKGQDGLDNGRGT